MPEDSLILSRQKLFRYHNHNDNASSSNGRWFIEVSKTAAAGLFYAVLQEFQECLAREIGSLWEQSKHIDWKFYE
jgi:hypothetical protein